MKELKPCPFCGGEAKLDEYLNIVPEIAENGAYTGEEIECYARCYCTVCKITTTGCATESEAIKAWNGRVENDRTN